MRLFAVGGLVVAVLSLQGIAFLLGIYEGGRRWALPADGGLREGRRYVALLGLILMAASLVLVSFGQFGLMDDWI